MPAPGPNVGKKTKKGADSGSRPGQWCRESTGEGRELPGGPSDLQETGRHWALGDPVQDGSFPRSRSLSEPQAVRLLAQSLRRPLHPQATWIWPGLQWAGHTQGPPGSPLGPHAGKRKPLFPGPCLLALLGFAPSPPQHPPGSRAAPLGRSGQPTADLPIPILAGQVAGFQRMVFPSCLQVGRAAPHQKGKNDTF